MRSGRHFCNPSILLHSMSYCFDGYDEMALLSLFYLFNKGFRIPAVAQKSGAVAGIHITTSLNEFYQILTPFPKLCLKL